MHKDSRLRAPTPTLPRKRGRERTAFAALFNEHLAPLRGAPE